MKRGILAGGFIGVALIALTFYVNSGSQEYYHPREESVKNDGISGAMEWLHSIRANLITNTIDPRDVIAARNATRNLKSKKGSALNLEWTSIGPTNIGGRTRAILFDKNNSNIMFAGAVSGGLFKSTTGGSSWIQVNDMASNLAVTSICQAANGDIYYGTGEGMYYDATGTGSGGIIGGGIFKSTDGGNTFNVLPSTVPAPNSENTDFAAVGKMAADPEDAQRIYAATNRGLMISSDGGNSWEQAISGGFSAQAKDMTITYSGKVWVKQGSSIYRSDNGDPGTYEEITVANAQNGEIPRNQARMRMAVSPEDENYVYVVATRFVSGTGQSEFDKAYQSKDGGETWRVIGQVSTQLNPHAQSQPQGEFNNALSVSAMDKERIFVGGVTFWEWSEQNGWLQAASTAFAPPHPFYVHADNHDVIFHPDDPATIYVVNDGGIFKSSDNGMTWSMEVRNYVTTQFYRVAVGNGKIMGGTQDNGTILIDPSSAQSQYGTRTPGITVRDVPGTRDGDGGYAEISKLNPDVMFKAMQYGVIGRSVDGGATYSLVYPENVAPTSAVGNNGFAAFVTPFALWENLNEPLSEDSVVFSADTVFMSIGFGNGSSSYSDRVRRPQESAIFVPEGLVISAGNQVVVSDEDGNLSGDGTGTYNDSTGAFTVNFNSPVNLEIIVNAAVRYEAGASVNVESAINSLPIPYTLTSALEPGESIRIQDPVQSMYAIGIRSELWLSRDVLNNNTLVSQSPSFYKVAEFANSGNPRDIEFSGDGNTIWATTYNNQSSRLYRITDLNNARDSISMHNGDSVTVDLVRTFSGQAITDIAIHPNDPDRVVVTLGNYGNTRYVYYSDNGTSASPTFAVAQGDLPEMPVYTATFNYKSENMDQVIIGTEEGIFVTDNISSASPGWVTGNEGLANVPVFDIVQEKTVRHDLRGPTDYEGAIYAGTHGRGIFRTGSASGPISVPEQKMEEEDHVQALNIYPNPANDKVKFAVKMDKESDVRVNIRNINGSLVKSTNYSKVNRNIEELSIDVSRLSVGTYILSVQADGKAKTGKLIISR